jgi:nucleoside-diphosphate-sugar epimerase
MQQKKSVTIFGDGTQKRAFTHIRDICNAISLLLNNPNAVGNEYNLSGPEEFSINELVSLLSKHFRISPEIIHKDSKVDELSRNLADTQPLKELGFEYNHYLEEYIKKM